MKKWNIYLGLLLLLQGTFSFCATENKLPPISKFYCDKTIFSDEPCAVARKQKMLILFTTTEIGGAAKALIDMIAKIDSVGVLPAEIDVCIVQKHGAFDKFFRQGIHFVSFKEARSTEYDIAISYSECIDPRWWVKKIQARKKLQWVHIDLVKSGWKLALLERANCDGIDHFVCVSTEVKQGFDNLYPDLSSRSVTVYNIIDNGLIHKQSEELTVCMPTHKKELWVVSVGRLSPQKGIDRAILVQKRLLKEGFSFRWFVVGDGLEREKLEKQIEKAHLKDNFVLLGLRTNPYPYMKKADIIAVPSRYEGYGLVVTEGKILGKPVLTTDFAGAKEQIVSEQTGIIVANDEEAIYKGLKRLLSDEVLRKKISQNLQGFEFDNSASLSTLKELFK